MTSVENTTNSDTKNIKDNNVDDEFLSVEKLVGRAGQIVWDEDELAQGFFNRYYTDPVFKALSKAEKKKAVKGIKTIKVMGEKNGESWLEYKPDLKKSLKVIEDLRTKKRI